jgi:hypothetical protein
VKIIQGFIIIMLIVFPFGLLVEKLVNFRLDNRKGTR